MNSYIITATGITLFFESDGSQHTIEKSHEHFNDIARLAVASRFDEILALLDVAGRINIFVYESKNGRFSIDDNVLSFDGQEMHSYLADRMVDLAVQGLDIKAMEEFMINLMSNSSYRAVTELYGFLEHGNLPITPDGHFLAYKKIRDDYTDCYTGKMDNSVGSIVEMPRNAVDEDKNVTCSKGLHFCSYDYLNHFRGERVVVLKINPRDVVSIPTDYGNAKGRACRYEVIRELKDWAGVDRIEGSISEDGSYDEREEQEEFNFEVPDEVGGYFIRYDGEEVDWESDNGDDGGDGEDDDSYHMYIESHAVDIFEDNDGDGEDDVDATKEDPNQHPLVSLKIAGQTIGYHRSIADASEATGVPEEYIRRVLANHRQSSFGYTFEMVNGD